MIQKKWMGVAIKSTVLLALLTAMVFSFQNCGKAGFDQADLGSEVAGLQVDSKLASLPFPYEVTVNQAAFMSCQFRGTDANAVNPYFSFKVGAFDNQPGSPTYSLVTSNAGLKVSQAFVDEFDHAAAGFNPNYRPTKYKEALTVLPSVANSQLQLSLRSRSSPQTEVMKYPSVGNYGGGDTPVKNFMAKVTSDAVAEVFKGYMDQEQPTFNFFQNGTAQNERSLEASLLVPWGSNDGAVEYYSPLLNSYSNSYLAIGFTKDGKNLSGSASDSSSAYGKGLKPDFVYYSSIINGSPVAPHGSRQIALKNLTEYDLSTGSASGAIWRCNDSRQALMAFKIVRNADRYTKIYRRNNFSWPDINGTGNQAANGTCPGQRFLGRYCPSPDNPRSFGRALTEFPVGAGYACPVNRRLFPAGAANTSGDPASGAQLATGTFHAYGYFCEEQYEYACPAEPMFPPTVLAGQAPIQGQPPLNEQAYLTSSPEKLAIYYALRRFLPESQWDINVSKRCIVERTNQDNVCYASGRPVIYDEYFFPDAGVAGLRDNVDLNYRRYAGCGPGEVGDCPAYLTMCVRQ